MQLQFPLGGLIGLKSKNTLDCRLLDNSFCWRKLAEESLLRYKDIENESNICFYEEVGYLSLIDEKVKNIIMSLSDTLFLKQQVWG